MVVFRRPQGEPNNILSPCRLEGRLAAKLVGAESRTVRDDWNS